eukprot:7276666-Pyramimonas_sp.AAC.1
MSQGRQYIRSSVRVINNRAASVHLRLAVGQDSTTQASEVLAPDRPSTTEAGMGGGRDHTPL